MAPLKRSPIRKVRSKPRPNRLKGKAKSDLREQCFIRDNYQCQHVVTEEVSPHGYTIKHKCLATVSDDLPDWHANKAHMAHIRNRRMWGDVLDNVSTRCKFHHIDVEHAYGPSHKKPVPSKIKGVGNEFVS